jgi:metal-sulfur cluster biosynthetic enzyme
MSLNLERLVEIALRDVFDPEIGRSVVDLGLIYAIAAAPDGNVAVTMTTTTRGCPLAGFLKEAVAMAAGAVEGVTGVTVTLTYEPAWEPAMIAAE